MVSSDLGQGVPQPHMHHTQRTTFLFASNSARSAATRGYQWCLPLRTTKPWGELIVRVQGQSLHTLHLMHAHPCLPAHAPVQQLAHTPAVHAHHPQAMAQLVDYLMVRHSRCPHDCHAGCPGQGFHMFSEPVWT